MNHDLNLDAETATLFKSFDSLMGGIDTVRQSPKDNGLLQLIVRRPDVDAREVVEDALLDPAVGLTGDSWTQRPSRHTPDKSPHPDMQLTIMNARAAELIAGDRNRWAIAGDQLYADLDLSEDNLPPGTRLQIGEAIVEVTAIPHRGCKKFRDRFGPDAVKFVNSDEGVSLNLRGINAKVIQGGQIKTNDEVVRIQ